TLFYTSERRSWIGNKTSVDGHHASFQALRNIQASRKALCVDICNQPVFGIVSATNGFFLGVKAEDRRNRTKYFCVYQFSVGAHVSQYGGKVVIPLLVKSLPAAHDFGALADGIINKIRYTFDGGRVNDRATFGCFLNAGPNTQCLHLLAECFDKSVVNAILDKDAVSGSACFATISHLGDHGAFYGFVQVGIVKHDEWSVPA